MRARLPAAARAPTCPRAAPTRLRRRVCAPRLAASNAAVDEPLGDSFVLFRAATVVITERIANGALDVAAEMSLRQAEQLKLLERLPQDPAGSIQRLVENAISGPVVDPMKVLQAAQELPDEIVKRAQVYSPSPPALGDEEPGPNDADVPEYPDVEETLDELRADIAEAQSVLRKWQATQKS